MQKEYTMVMIKPGSVKKRVAGEIISRFEKTGMNIEKMKLNRYPKSTIKELYREHEGKDFYNNLIETISGQRIVVMVLSAKEDVIKKVRKMNGATNPVEAKPGTIRGDYGCYMGPDNVVHASDSKEAAAREINLFFPDFLE